MIRQKFNDLDRPRVVLATALCFTLLGLTPVRFGATGVGAGLVPTEPEDMGHERSLGLRRSEPPGF